MTIADRLRELAQGLPTGSSLMLTRDGLLELAAVEGAQAGQASPRADFTAAELAAHFNRSVSTVRDWCEHGRFEGAYKLNGRDWRIPRAAVDAFLAEQRGERNVAQLGAWRARRGARSMPQR